jgi:hypothetical protein
MSHHRWHGGEELLATGDEQCVGADQKTIARFVTRRKGGIDHRDSAQLKPQRGRNPQRNTQYARDILFLLLFTTFLRDS